MNNKLLNKIMRKIYILLMLSFLSLCLSAQKKNICLGLDYIPQNNIVILNIKPQDMGMSRFNATRNYISASTNKPMFEGYTGLVPSNSALYFESRNCNYVMPIQDDAILEEVYIDCKNNSKTRKTFKIAKFAATIKSSEYLEIECIVLNQKYPKSFIGDKVENYITYIRRITRYVYVNK